MQIVVFDDISEIFKFELCNIPSSLFNTNEFPRELKKSLFSDVLWVNAVYEDKHPLRIR